MAKKKNDSMGTINVSITEQIERLFSEVYETVQAEGKMGVGFFEIPLDSMGLTKEDVDTGVLEADLEEFGKDPDVNLITDKEESKYRIRIYTTPEGIHTIVTAIQREKPTIG